MARRSSAPESKILAAIAAVDAGLTQRAAAKRYEVPLGTLKTRLRRRREAQEPDASTPAADSNRIQTADVSTSPEGTDRPIPAEVIEDERLDAKRFLAAKMEVQGASIADIAGAVGARPRTLYTWRKDPVYQAVCSDLRAEIHRQTRESVARGAEEAMEAKRLVVRLAQRLAKRAHDLLDKAEAGEASWSDALKAVDKALAVGARFGGAEGTVLMKAGGLPSVERIEVSQRGGGESPHELKQELQELLATLPPELRALDGGAS